MPNDNTLLTACLVAAGLGQIALVIASLWIPAALDFRGQLARLRPILRELFWTYAGYIWLTNLCFGLLSALAPGWLTDGSPLAAVVSGYIFLYWAARVTIQFAGFDRSDMPVGRKYRLAEAALVSLFVFLTVTYGWTAVANLRAILS